MLFSTRRCFKDRATRAQSAGWAHLLAKKRTNVGWLVTQYRFTPGGNTRSAHARAVYRLYASSSSRKSWWSGWITSMPALKKPLQDDRGGDVQKQTRKADAQGNPAKGVSKGSLTHQRGERARARVVPQRESDAASAWQTRRTVVVEHLIAARAESPSVAVAVAEARGGQLFSRRHLEGEEGVHCTAADQHVHVHVYDAAILDLRAHGRPMSAQTLCAPSDLRGDAPFQRGGSACRSRGSAACAPRLRLCMPAGRRAGPSGPGSGAALA